ncbi:insulinase family protein, partial [Oceanospirillum sp. D5]|nr:insulinase family protein [Oceanospirillum sediminis]
RIASYTARMLNKGTTNNSRQEIEDKLSALKSSIRFSGSNGRISANISTTEEHLMETVALMTDMLKNPAFNEAELEKLKTADLANIERNKTEPQFLASKKLSSLNQHYEKGHPLYAPSIEDD